MCVCVCENPLQQQQWTLGPFLKLYSKAIQSSLARESTSTPADHLTRSRVCMCVRVHVRACVGVRVLLQSSPLLHHLTYIAQTICSLLLPSVTFTTGLRPPRLSLSVALLCSTFSLSFGSFFCVFCFMLIAFLVTFKKKTFYLRSNIKGLIL